jgi:putative oxidoreductase
MASFLTPFRNHLYAVLRIVVGFTFLWHGAQKLFDFPAGGPEGIPDFVVYVGGPIELVGGFLVMVGLMTRWAAFLCSGFMASAYWLAHGTKAILPIMNGGELAVIYCFVFLYIAAHGSGIWSVDASRSGAGGG